MHSERPKNAENFRKIAKKYPKRPKLDGCGGLRVPVPSLREDAVPGSLPRWWVSSHAVRGPPRIVTLRGSARGSYLETLPQSSPDFFKSFHILAQTFPNAAQNEEKSSLNLPQILPKIHAKGVLEPILDQCFHKA